MQQNVRPDTAEQYFIGEAFSISTTKHPTLGANFLEVIFQLTGSPAATYICTSLALLAMLTAVWKLSKEFLPLPLAVLALLASCNYRYMNIGAAYFHNSISILPFWCLTVLFFYYACKTGKLRWWLFTGITLGLGLNCKYPMGLLAITLFLFTVFFRRNIDCKDAAEYKVKRCPAIIGLLLVILISAVLFFPHINWNMHHGFPTLTFVSTFGGGGEAGDGEKSASPEKFLFSSAVMLLPVLVSLLPLFRKRKSAMTCNQTGLTAKIPNWQYCFLPFIFAVPLLLQVSFITVSGNNIQSRHGTHLWLFLPLLLVWYFSSTANTASIRKAFIYSTAVMILTLGIFTGYYIFEPLFGKRPNDTLFPGRELAAEAEKIWHSKYIDVPIPFAAGEWKLSGNLALYSKDRPKVLAFGGSESHFGGGGNDYFRTKGLNITPWYTPDDLQKGAVILWIIRDGNPLVPANLTDDFPNAVPLDTEITLEYRTFWQQYRKNKFPPLRIGIAIIPPEK